MIRHFLWQLVFALLLASAVSRTVEPAFAQQRLPLLPPVAVSPVTSPPPNATPAPRAAISAEQAREALDILNDPKKRAAFAATLEALINAPPQPAAMPPGPNSTTSQSPSAPPGTAEKTTLEGLPIPLAPDSLGAEVLLTASAFLNDLGEDAVRAFRAVQSFPLLWSWIVVMLTNPLGQQLLKDAGWRLAVAVVLAAGAELTLRLLLRRPMARVIALGQTTGSGGQDNDDAATRAEMGAIEPPPRHPGFKGAGRRLRLGLARFGLTVAPVLGLLIAGHAVAASRLGGQTESRLIVLAVVEAIAASQTLIAVLILLFQPCPPGLKLFAIRQEAGSYAVRWGRRLILIAVPGYAIGEVGLLLGMSSPAHDALQKTVGLVLLACLSIIVVECRRDVRRWLSAPPEAEDTLSKVRNRVASRWYLIALFFLASTWLSWTLHAPDVIARSLRYFAATAAVLVGAALARMAVTELVARIRPESDELSADGTRYTVRVRLSAYHHAIQRMAILVINVLAVLGLLQLYGLNGLTWLLATDVGHRVMSGLGTLVATVAVALAVWEGFNIAIQSHLESLRRDAQVARSARLRTLLPLMRSALWITIFLIAGAMILSEIGVDIAPLLAGAGIVGVAIGFGSQKLVQDVITGVFLLLENTMQVGDFVRVGDQSGVVESLSVRAIRLRTEDASVVVIPFSAVTTVVNMTRDFSRAVIQVSVGTGEDVGRVVAAMRAIVREMRQEDAWSTIVLDDLEVLGVDQVTDSALVIKGRIMCTPFGRWPVGREFNQRMIERFHALGIAAPDTSTRLVLDAPLPTAGHEDPSAREIPGPPNRHAEPRELAASVGNPRN